ncbi:MAG: GspE/PulE family protein [Gemmataceae bacterium]
MSETAQELVTLAGRPEGTVPLVDRILALGEAARASDLHIEPQQDQLLIRFRIDGVMQTIARLPGTLAPNCIARLKVMASLLTYRMDIPQEGGIRAAPGQGVERRVSTFPTVFGEKAVVRLFSTGPAPATLAELGFEPEQQLLFRRMLTERSGAIYLTGPSGSGKTTTIYAALQQLMTDSPGRHVVTIEDPVERILPGITQSAARPGTDFDFARGLRSLLRQDPDVIMVGEIRDRATAQVSVEAALTGHLVFSTLHAGSACGVLSRLLEMGIEPYQLTSGTRAIVNQRLLREQTPAGLAGRFLIAEFLTLTPELRQGVLRKAELEELEGLAAQQGFQPLRSVADAAVARGQTTAAEVLRVLGPRN